MTAISLRGWTDYPIVALGDMEGQLAPVRECRVLKWDGDKYCEIRVEGVEIEIKRAYVYSKPGRVGEVPPLTLDALRPAHGGVHVHK